MKTLLAPVERGQPRVLPQRVARRRRVAGGSVAADLFDRGLCLPSGSQMTDADCQRVVWPPSCPLNLEVPPPQSDAALWSGRRLVDRAVIRTFKPRTNGRAVKRLMTPL